MLHSPLWLSQDGLMRCMLNWWCQRTWCSHVELALALLRKQVLVESRSSRDNATACLSCPLSGRRMGRFCGDTVERLTLPRQFVDRLGQA